MTAKVIAHTRVTSRPRRTQQQIRTTWARRATLIGAHEPMSMEAVLAAPNGGSCASAEDQRWLRTVIGALSGRGAGWLSGDLGARYRKLLAMASRASVP